jgi:hypothetical protein
MNIRKFIPILLLSFSTATALPFYACNSTKSAASGTGGSVRDTTSTRAVKSSGSKIMSAANGTGGSVRDTTSIKKN